MVSATVISEPLTQPRDIMYEGIINMPRPVQFGAKVGHKDTYACDIWCEVSPST
jgi:hypothetical protein